MKYKGKKLEGRNTDILVLPRGNDRIVLKFQAVESYDDFDKLVPVPESPEILKPGGIREKNTNDPNYIKTLEAYAQLKTDWLIITSLKSTVDLEWDEVNYTDSATWGNWQKELREAGFTEVECMHIVKKTTLVNSLDEDMLEQARADFLAEESQVEKSLSQKGEQPSI